jgi:hypothetical protein
MRVLGCCVAAVVSLGAASDALCQSGASARKPAAAASGAGPTPGTYLCWSARTSELMAEDARQAQASGAPAVLPDRIIQSVTGGSPGLKYLVRPNGTFADVTWGAKFAADPKYNGVYVSRGGLIHLSVGGMPLYSFRRAQGSDGVPLLVQVREGKPADPYVSNQVCRRTSD